KAPNEVLLGLPADGFACRFLPNARRRVRTRSRPVSPEFMTRSPLRPHVILRPGASRRTFCEYLFSGYNHSHAVRSLPFARLGSSAGAGMVHRALLHADGAAGAGLAAYSGRPHHAD